MRALCFHAERDVRVDRVPDPKCQDARDAIVRVSLSGLSGGDLHLYHGRVPGMKAGDILGHEFCGEIVELGSSVPSLALGDRVVVPSIIACGHCFHCRHEEWALCDHGNPNAKLAQEAFGFSAAGIFGYTHLFGGYAGSDAEYIRVPFADVGAHRIPDHVSDAQALFASDTLPAGMMAAEMCRLRPASRVAVWGAGPVGQCAMLAARLHGAERVFAIDNVPSRLEMASRFAGAEPIDFDKVDVLSALNEYTEGRGPDACIDAVGLEAHGPKLEEWYDRAKHAVRLETDRPSALRQAILACRKGGTVAVVGTYMGVLSKLPIGAAMSKGLTLRLAQQNGHKYLPGLLAGLAHGQLDPSFLISHRFSLERASDGLKLLETKADDCMKILLTPN